MALNKRKMTRLMYKARIKTGKFVQLGKMREPRKDQTIMAFSFEIKTDIIFFFLLRSLFLKTQNKRSFRLCFLTKIIRVKTSRKISSVFYDYFFFVIFVLKKMVWKIFLAKRLNSSFFPLIFSMQKL